MVVPPSPRISSHFVRPFQDFIATAHSQLLSERRHDNFQHAVDDRTAHEDRVEEPDEAATMESSCSCQAQLLAAIINNSPEDVEALFSMEERQQENHDTNNSFHPNFSFVISRIPQKEIGRNNMDLLFAVRALLGESPSPMHLAILNVFFRSTNSGGSDIKFHAQRMLQSLIKYRSQDSSEIDKSHQIIQILMEQHADMLHSSPTLFGQQVSSPALGKRQVTPLDMGWYVHNVLSKTQEYDMNQMEALLFDWEEKFGKKHEGDQRDEDEDDLGSHDAFEARNSASSHIPPTMVQEILINLFENKPKEAYILLTTTTLGLTGGEFGSSTVICGQGFHLLCNDAPKMLGSTMPITI